MAITFINSGSAASADNASVSPVRPNSYVSGDLLLLFATARGTGTLGASADWTLYQNWAHSSSNVNQISLFYKFATKTSAADSDPTVTYTSGASGDTVIVDIAAFRGVSSDGGLTFVQAGSLFSSGTTQNIGAITGITTTKNNSMVIVLGHKADDWTSVATISGDSLTWAEAGEADSTVGTDAGTCWDYCLDAGGSGKAIANKTFTVTGGGVSTSIGVVIEVGFTSPPKPLFIANPLPKLPYLGNRTWIDQHNNDTLQVLAPTFYGAVGQAITYDWQLPMPARQQPLENKTWIVSNLNNNVLYGQDKVYAGPGQVPTYDLPNPISVLLPVVEERTLENYTWLASGLNDVLRGQDKMYAGPGEVPDYDWQNALPPIGNPPQRENRTWVQDHIQDTLSTVPPAFYGAVGQAPTYDWQLPPKGYKRPIEGISWTVSHINDVLFGQDIIYGAPGEVTSYIWQTALPPTGCAPHRENRTWIQDHIQDTLSTVPPLFYGEIGQAITYDWQLPPHGPARSIENLTFNISLVNNVLFGQDIIYAGPGQVPTYDYPTRLRLLWSNDNRTWTQNLLEQSLTPKPEGTYVDWPNPLPRMAYRGNGSWVDQHNLDVLYGQDKMYDGPGQVPNYDWTVPRGATPYRENKTWNVYLGDLLTGVVSAAPFTMYDWVQTLRHTAARPSSYTYDYYVNLRPIREHLQFIVGHYTGTGATLNVPTPGVDPSLVIVRSRGTDAAVFCTTQMAGVATKPFVGTSDISNGITALGTGQFTVVSDATTNANGVIYDFLAVQDVGAGDFEVGTYIGNGIDNRTIPTAMSSPAMVMIVRITTSSFRAHWLSNLHGSPDDARLFSSATAQANTIQQLVSTGFEVGTSTSANANTAVYYYVAFKEVPGIFDLFTYTGNGIDNRSFSGLGLVPQFVTIQDYTATLSTVMRFKDQSGDISSPADGASLAANVIQAFEGDGVNLGTNNRVNANADVYIGFAFGAPAPTFYGAIGQAPIYTWPLPPRYRPRYETRTWIENLRGLTVAINAIYGAPGEVPTYDWPNPLRRAPHRINRFWYSSMIRGEVIQISASLSGLGSLSASVTRKTLATLTLFGNGHMRANASLNVAVKILDTINLLDSSKYRIVPITLVTPTLARWQQSPPLGTARLVMAIRCLGSSLTIRLANAQALTDLIDSIAAGTPVNWTEQTVQASTRSTVVIVDGFYEQSVDSLLVAILWNT